MSLFHNSSSTDLRGYLSWFRCSISNTFLVQVDAFIVFDSWTFDCLLKISFWVTGGASWGVFSNAERPLSIYFFFFLLNYISIWRFSFVLGNSPGVLFLLYDCRMRKRMNHVALYWGILLSNLHIWKVSLSAKTPSSSFLAFFPNNGLVSLLQICQIQILVLLFRSWLSALSLQRSVLRLELNLIGSKLFLNFNLLPFWQNWSN